MVATSLSDVRDASMAGRIRPFARVLSERLAALERRPGRAMAAGSPLEAPKFGADQAAASMLDDVAARDFYSRALVALEAEASRVSGRVEVSIEEAFLAASCMAGAPNLAKAIDRASRFYAALSRAAGCPGRSSLQLLVSGARAEVRIYAAGPGPDEPASSMIALLGAVFHIRLFGWLIGEDIGVETAATSCRQHLGEDALREVLPWPIAFAADLGPCCEVRITFASHHLTRPIVRTGADFEQLQLMDLLIMPATPSSTASAVRRQIMLALRRGLEVPSAARLAALCHRSPATLRRHLAREHTSVRAIRDECVRERALQLLHDRSMLLGDIATRLGFSDAPCFRRAFRRWTGMSPAAYRRQAASSLAA